MTPTPNTHAAPSQEALMKELGIKPRPKWLRNLPIGISGLITNKKGLAGAIIMLVLLLSALFAPILATHNPFRIAGSPHIPPGAEHYMGTTRMGRDVFSQLIYGARTSLLVGFIAGFSATLIGLVVGISAGYFRGKIDEILTFFVNVVLVMPALPLIIVFAAYIEKATPALIGLVLAATGWGWAARTIRTQTLAIRSKEFVLAAELGGEKKWRIIIMEIFPNMLSFIVGGFVLATIYAILAEAGLEFIGLGDPSAVTWGTMLYAAERAQALRTGGWWEVWPECIAIMVTGGALVMINFAVDEITNPQLKAGRNSRKVKAYLAKRGRSIDVF